ncbi:hypothetical protein B0H16DRAFT_1584898 [Mycena metata]|uniref:F-box domain-containing protein n=1 Tax=Mycena metata TaxID=1033252 RepID=A0AAD7HYA6_9AGAR|nr:hypothetical protein B0H16DRAFT_1584898 [Mycena metata]
MDTLPDELLDRVCSLLDRRDLWKATQVSSRFRRLAILPYLATFGISQADIQSGTLSLSDSFFLIIVVAHITPIQRLVCFDKPVSPGIRLKRLARILSMTAPIPDILIYNKHYMVQRTRRETAFLLAHIPSAVTRPLLVVHRLTMQMSRPRSAPPIQWRLLPPPLGSSNLPTKVKVLIVMFGIPLVFAYLVSGIINLGVVGIWAYRRFFGPPWSQEDRILEDVGPIIFEDWMRIQSIPGKYTLVTLVDKRWPMLELRPRPRFTDDIYSIVLTSLDYGPDLKQLWVEQNTNLVYTEVMAFLQRHPNLTDIGFTSGSIRPSSLPPTIPPQNSGSQVNFLTTTSIYVPYLLPAAPNLHRIFIHPNRAAAATRIGGSLAYVYNFDLPAYHAALDALAALPGTHPIELHLSFPLPAGSLPWLVLPNLPPTAAVSLPETRLVRIRTLDLYCGTAERFRAAEIRERLIPWLALFPSLERLTFAYATVEKIPAAERVVLAEAVRAACAGITTTSNVAFNVLED